MEVDATSQEDQLPQWVRVARYLGKHDANAEGSAFVIAHGSDPTGATTFCPVGREVGFYTLEGHNALTALTLSALSAHLAPISEPEEMPNYRLSKQVDDESLARRLQAVTDSTAAKVYFVTDETYLCTTPAECLAQRLSAGVHHQDCRGLFNQVPDLRLLLLNCRGVSSSRRSPGTRNPQHDGSALDADGYRYIEDLKRFRRTLTDPDVYVENPELYSRFQSLSPPTQAILLTNNVIHTFITAQAGLRAASARRADPALLRSQPVELTRAWVDRFRGWAADRVPHERLPELHGLCALALSVLSFPAISDWRTAATDGSAHDVLILLSRHKTALGELPRDLTTTLRTMAIALDLATLKTDQLRRSETAPTLTEDMRQVLRLLNWSRVGEIQLDTLLGRYVEWATYVVEMVKRLLETFKAGVH
ncbi:hypothetical protein [Crossiella cryophila]|uniref:Uncharacterized protein n=1 Tax=Crossiella cryophila TaxID=43355 RepID=A0A7W7FV36_9PSEU|nr:hypothetical protein [Crossiella cryophila]MBB4680001.1 hypothetical protein [Crossiella cryophila]